MTQFRSFVGVNRDICKIKSSDIERWAADLKVRGYSPASIRRKIVVLKVFCSYWVRQGVLSESPFWRVKISFGNLVQLPRHLSAQETEALLTQVQKHYSLIKASVNDARPSAPDLIARDLIQLRNVALIEVMFATGMRVGEVAALNIHDFMPSETAFRVSGKGGKERLAFIVDRVTSKTIVDYFKARQRLDSKSSALFLNANGSRLSTQGIANVLRQLQHDSGLQRRITPHMLRHTVATLLLRNGVDIRIVQEFLGHSSIATTQRYTHVAKEHMLRELKERHPSLRLRGRRAAA